MTFFFLLCFLLNSYLLLTFHLSHSSLFLITIIWSSSFFSPFETFSFLKLVMATRSTSLFLILSVTSGISTLTYFLRFLWTVDFTSIFYSSLSTTFSLFFFNLFFFFSFLIIIVSVSFSADLSSNSSTKVMFLWELNLFD